MTHHRSGQERGVSLSRLQGAKSDRFGMLLEHRRHVARGDGAGLFALGERGGAAGGPDRGVHPFGFGLGAQRGHRELFLGILPNMSKR